MTMLPEWPTKYRVISVEDNLVQLQSMDGRLLSTKTPYASVKPLRQSLCFSKISFLLSCLCLQQVTCISTSTASDSTSSKTEQGTLEDGDIIITDVQSGWPLPTALSGRVDDFSVMLLSPHTWLDDHVIDHAQALLKEQFPSTEGLHATTSMALLSTLPAATQGFVQIFNVCANHWVTNGLLTPFPKSVKSLSVTVAQTMDVDVHCHCRRTIRAGKDPVVACRRCGQLFHQFCLNGVQDVAQYVCPSCSVIMLC
ncbi:hypothetical protein ACEWY4_013960 [Coilia grayii]|uniref:RING-type domain-containing protein n=1 Tax=Coilia grayii TaxID=363190 RepID=A0ABD1JQX7_9TELE